MHIGIAGAGLAGRLLAWRLLRLGHAVTLVDQDDGSGQQAAGHIAAAMLAPFSEAVGTGHALLAPGRRSIALWHDWMAELQADSGMDVAWQQQGSVIVAHPMDRTELRWFHRRVQALPDYGTGDCAHLDRPALLALEPELTAFDEGLFLPGEACLDNRSLLQALRHAILRRGGKWRSGCVVVELVSKRLVLADTQLDFDIVVDCRGFGAKHQMPTLRGVRGELLWLHAPDVHLRRPVRLMHPRYQLYIAPRPGQIYVIGATELESESMAPVTVRSQLELLSTLYSVHDGFGEASVLEARSHCRPAFSDNLPRLSVEPGLLRLNGLYRHGYLLGPLLIESTLAALHAGEPLFPIQMQRSDVLITAHSAPLEEFCHD